MSHHGQNSRRFCNQHQRQATFKWNSRNVLLRLVILLGQVFGRGFAGDLDEGQLFAEARHVAGCLANAVVIVSFHQKI